LLIRNLPKALISAIIAVFWGELRLFDLLIRQKRTTNVAKVEVVLRSLALGFAALFAKNSTPSFS
jgi:hypothetical protein